MEFMSELSRSNIFGRSELRQRRPVNGEKLTYLLMDFMGQEIRRKFFNRPGSDQQWIHQHFCRLLFISTSV